ncbi:MAG TPA: glycerophosphodiester phosphodiesterase family protein [Allosphingosinicella sp.]|nr:glycerophosphodiester phosphodiesterase family protein [Allosphingosinicella sp.]
MTKTKWALLALALAALTLSLTNASWIAPEPEGALILVAHRGIAQPMASAPADSETCAAAHIRPSDHMFIENTLFSIQHAVRLGADAVELDVSPSRDGQMMVFHDLTLDCRTDGTGRLRDRTLAELKRIDVGYGYTPDGGKTFPLRGRGVGAMPTVEEVVKALPRTPLIFHIKSREPGDADLLLAALGRAGAKADGHGFYGNPRVIARVRQIAPAAWAFTKQAARNCLTDYLKFGWSGYMPARCRNTTVVVPLNYQWAVWGWPNRFLARMTAAGSTVMLAGDYRDGAVAGLERPEQLGEVPRDFRGRLWIENMYDVGRALN